MQAVIEAISVFIAKSNQSFTVVDCSEGAPAFSCDEQILRAAERVVLFKLGWVILGV